MWQGTWSIMANKQVLGVLLITGLIAGPYSPAEAWVPNPGAAVCAPPLVHSSTERSCPVKELKEQLVGSQVKLCLKRQLLASGAGKHFQDGMRGLKEWDFRALSQWENNCAFAYTCICVLC